MIQVAGSGGGFGGIYSGSGTSPAGVAVTITDYIDFGSALIYLKKSNDRIGIGTSSPGNDLSIEKDSTGTVGFDVTNSHKYWKYWKC